MKQAAALIIAIAAIATGATASDLAFGPRLGYTRTGSADQVHFGGHVALMRLTPNLQLIPSLEVGSGDGTLIALNGDVLYEFTELADGPWSFYGGGGPVVTRYDHGQFDSTDFALSLVAGITHSTRADRHWFGELRLGLEDAPDLKLTVGLTFR